MTRIAWGACLLALVLPLALAVGCGDKSTDKAAPAGSGCGCAETGCGCGCGCGEADAAKITAALDQLAPSDRAMAVAQKTCPVTGEELGSMGVPVKVMVKERAVFLCCPSCKKKIEADPDKYLAILDAKGG